MPNKKSLSADMDARAFQNAIRILNSIDAHELAELPDAEASRFVRDPMLFLLQADERAAAAVWRVVLRRMPARTMSTPSLDAGVPSDA